MGWRSALERDCNLSVAFGDPFACCDELGNIPLGTGWLAGGGASTTFFASGNMLFALPWGFEDAGDSEEGGGSWSLFVDLFGGAADGN